MNTTSEHPAVATALHGGHPIPHVIYWSHVRDKAEECVRDILNDGDTPTSLIDILGKNTIDSPDDWDELMDYCKEHGAVCHDINKLYRASAAWLQAFNELEYKRLYP